MQEPIPSTPTDVAEPEQGQALVAQGREHYARAEYYKALACLQLAYDVILAEKQTADVAEIANDIGVVHTVLERWEDAEKWLSEAQHRFAASGDLSGEAQTLGNMGSMYRVQRDHRQAAAHLQLSADRFHLVGDDERRSASLRALSLVRLRQLRPLEAVAAYHDALACHPRPNLVTKLLQKLFSLPSRLLGR